MDVFKIFILLTLFGASFLLIFWIFRPGSKKIYQDCSMIPFNRLLTKLPTDEKFVVEFPKKSKKHDERE